MKLRDKLCILMLAAMLVQLLAACHVAAPAEVSGTPDASNRPAQSHGAGESRRPSDSEEPSPEPSEEVSLWDPEHRLDVSFTPAKGLELPVSGATGYASVELPLWEELPEEDEGKLATIYAPPEPEPEPEPTPEPTDEPTEEPTDEPTDEPSPAPSVSEPDPAEEEPGPEESSGDPAAVQSDDTPPAAETQEPAPTESAENESAPPVSTEEIFIDPIVEPTSESTLEPDPEPTPTSDSEPEPEPEPTPDPLEDALLVLEPGTAFVILSESGDWWQVRVKGGETGWVEHRYCLINLPDVIPSMIYNDTNAYSSVFVSSGKSIPNITGKALYQATAQNNRLGRKEFMMPVLYAMAKNICQAQQNALSEGNTIVLYEGYRPTSAQMAVVRSLSVLARKDSEVKAGISTPPWNISWFIATGVSNHQQGYAMDVSLAKVTQAHVETIGGYNVIQVDQYEEYTMPTPIHELSMAAATYTRPVAIFSNTAWRTAKLTPAMSANQPALALQRYCTESKLTPLASEWWHFNDLAAYSQTKDYSSSGGYEIRDCLSVAP